MVFKKKKVKKLKAISYFPGGNFFFPSRTQGVRGGGNLVEPTRADEVPVWRESWRNWGREVQ